LLEENSLGEFGWNEVLKQFEAGAMAKSPPESWNGDRYATFEEKTSKQLMLFTRLRLVDQASASVFFAQYCRALAKKYPDRFHITERANYLAFDSSNGSVYFRCEASECISLEGGTSGIFLHWLGKLGWQILPRTPEKSDPSIIQTTLLTDRSTRFDPVIGIR